MNLKLIQYLIYKQNALQESDNYFLYHNNYSFTSQALKEKRVLGHLLKKFSMLPEFQELSLKIMEYLLKSYKSQDKVLDDLIYVNYNHFRSFLLQYLEQFTREKSQAFTYFKLLYQLFSEIYEKNQLDTFKILVKLLIACTLFNKIDEAKNLLKMYLFLNLNIACTKGNLQDFNNERDIKIRQNPQEIREFINVALKIELDHYESNQFDSRRKISYNKVDDQANYLESHIDWKINNKNENFSLKRKFIEMILIYKLTIQDEVINNIIAFCAFEEALVLMLLKYFEKMQKIEEEKYKFYSFQVLFTFLCQNIGSFLFLQPTIRLGSQQIWKIFYLCLMQTNTLSQEYQEQNNNFLKINAQALYQCQFACLKSEKLELAKVLSKCNHNKQDSQYLQNLIENSKLADKMTSMEVLSRTSNQFEIIYEQIKVFLNVCKEQINK